MSVEIDEDEVFPDVDADRNKTVIGAIEVANAFEFNHAFEGPVVAVGPSVIGTTEILDATLVFRDDRSGMVAADVVEGPESAIVAADDDKRFFVHVDGEKVAGFPDLVKAADDLPIACEDGVAFELSDAFVEVPGGRYGPGIFKGVRRIVEIENFSNRLLGHKDRLRI